MGWMTKDRSRVYGQKGIEGGQRKHRTNKQVKFRSLHENQDAISGGDDEIFANQDTTAKTPSGCIISSVQVTQRYIMLVIARLDVICRGHFSLDSRPKLLAGCKHFKEFVKNLFSFQVSLPFSLFRRNLLFCVKLELFMQQIMLLLLHQWSLRLLIFGTKIAVVQLSIKFISPMLSPQGPPMSVCAK